MTVLTTFLRLHTTTPYTYSACADIMPRRCSPVHTCCTPRAVLPTMTTADQPTARVGHTHIGHESYAPNIRTHTRVLRDNKQAMRSGRCCSCGALQQLQLQLTALGVLQQQHADTPKFVSASSGGLQRALSENGNESRKTKAQRAMTLYQRQCS